MIETHEPWWADLIRRYGFSTAAAVFLGWYLVSSVAVEIIATRRAVEALTTNQTAIVATQQILIDQMKEHAKETRAASSFLEAICLNSADGALMRSRCMAAVR